MAALTLGCAVCLTVAPGAVFHASAAAPPAAAGCTNGSGNPVTYDPNNPNPCIGTGGVDANGNVTCTQNGKTCVGDCSAAKTTSAGCPARSTGIAFITNYADPLINFAAGIFGVYITIIIVVAGIQYSTSADDPSKTSAAKSRITDAVIALLAFLFLYTFLQWITPGGFLN